MNHRQKLQEETFWSLWRVSVVALQRFWICTQKEAICALKDNNSGIPFSSLIFSITLELDSAVKGSLERFAKFEGAYTLDSIVCFWFIFIAAFLCYSPHSLRH